MFPKVLPLKSLNESQFSDLKRHLLVDLRLVKNISLPEYLFSKTDVALNTETKGSHEDSNEKTQNRKPTN